MVLYSTVTTYQLLEAMTYHLKYKKDEDAILLISHWLENKYPWYKKLETLFDKVVVFNGNYACDGKEKENLNAYFYDLLENNNISIDQMDEIHVYGAEHSFGAFIAINNYPYIYWEEGAGALSKRDEMQEIFAKAYGKEKADFQCGHHLHDGESSFVTRIYYDRYFQLKEVSGDKLVHFDVCEELDTMKEGDRDQIINIFYGKDKIEVEDHTSLILTEHFANLSVSTWEEQEYLYKYLVDYFMDGKKLLFKPHPDDLMYYEYLFENCKVIRKKFPAELLPYIFTTRPEMVATSSSTSIYGLRKLFDKVLEFDFEFSHRKMFYRLNRYFAALRIAERYVKDGYRLKLVGINDKIVHNFSLHGGISIDEYDVVDFADIVQNSSKHIIWMVDEFEHPHECAGKLSEFLKKLPENTPVIFMNSEKDYSFYDYDNKYLWNYMHPIHVYTRPLGKDKSHMKLSGPSVTDNVNETFYVFLKGDNFMMYEVDKELPNVGVSVHSEDFDKDKLQIKILEGLLEASEKRVLYYIGREKELMEELEEK